MLGRTHSGTAGQLMTLISAGYLAVQAAKRTVAIMALFMVAGLS
ncbi:hypothetical protein [Kingella kingae]|nr:hypothetical protein [Kingella kingae]MDK4529757.1 hypothetical protein [Kingella kingae]MDK4580744.1 hypothetical protein [Kingella kingae]